MEPPPPGISKLKPSPTKSEIDQLYDIFTVLLLLYRMSKYLTYVLNCQEGSKSMDKVSVVLWKIGYNFQL